MILTVVLGTLALLSLALTVWQGIVAWRFPLHERAPVAGPAPAVTLLKPLKGCDPHTETCLRSWLEQDYPGPVQVLFGVASQQDPSVAVVERLLAEFPQRNARLVVCPERLGANAKVSTLAGLEREAQHDILVVSDADVRVPSDLLANVVPFLQQPVTGLVCCFYRMSNPANLAMRWEAVATNADFWSAVLQARSLKPLDFALGAVMALPRKRLIQIGGFRSLADYLADDYQLGRRIAAEGGQIALCPVVVDCLSGPMTWREVWAHQLRWSRTIRVCQPGPYFFSILSSAALWPLLWLAARPDLVSLAAVGLCLAVRWLVAWSCERRLAGAEAARAWWLAPAKDLAQVAVWALAFVGNRVVWRDQPFRVTAGGKLVRVVSPEANPTAAEAPQPRS